MADSETSHHVLILSGDTGEGHHAAARAVARDMVRCDPRVRVEIQDGLRLCGRVVNGLVHGGCRMQVRSGLAPTMYGLLHGAIIKIRFVRRFGYFILLRLGAGPLGSHLEQLRPDVVVSTHPLVSVVLGCLRLRYGLPALTATAVIDLGGLEFWAARGVDLHMVMHRFSAAEVERLGRGGECVVVRPTIDPSFFEPLSPTEARRLRGLPADAPLVVVSGGGWGVGDLAGAVETVLSLPRAHAVCVTGRNQELLRELQARYAAEPRVHVYGFTPYMSELMAAADALVHSTGGITCLEAVVRGCPIITYGTPAGHARLYCAALETAGLSRRAANRRALRHGLQSILSQPRPLPLSPEGRPSAGQAILRLLSNRAHDAEFPRR